MCQLGRSYMDPSMSTLPEKYSQSSHSNTDRHLFYPRRSIWPHTYWHRWTTPRFRKFLLLTCIDLYRSFYTLDRSHSHSRHYSPFYSPSISQWLDKWTQTLPIVLLGIRSAIKEDNGCTPAELVYGTTLRLPGSFFVTTDTPCSDPADYVNRLKTAMKHLLLDRPLALLTFLPICFLKAMFSFVTMQYKNAIWWTSQRYQQD